MVWGGAWLWGQNSALDRNVFGAWLGFWAWLALGGTICWAGLGFGAGLGPQGGEGGAYL